MQDFIKCKNLKTDMYYNRVKNYKVNKVNLYEEKANLGNYLLCKT